MDKTVLVLVLLTAPLFSEFLFYERHGPKDREPTCSLRLRSSRTAESFNESCLRFPEPGPGPWSVPVVFQFNRMPLTLWLWRVWYYTEKADEDSMHDSLIPIWVAIPYNECPIAIAKAKVFLF